jgi:hypothetical protein
MNSELLGRSPGLPNLCQPSHPEGQWQEEKTKGFLLGLQLRGQLRICTVFPFKVLLKTDKTTKARQRYKIIFQKQKLCKF